MLLGCCLFFRAGTCRARYYDDVLLGAMLASPLHAMLGLYRGFLIRVNRTVDAIFALRAVPSGATQKHLFLIHLALG